MEEKYAFETSVNLQRTTRRYMPEDKTHHIYRCKDLKDYINEVMPQYLPRGLINITERRRMTFVLAQIRTEDLCIRNIEWNSCKVRTHDTPKINDSCRAMRHAGRTEADDTLNLRSAVVGCVAFFLLSFLLYCTFGPWTNLQGKSICALFFPY
jgi:hypothetical protein